MDWRAWDLNKHQLSPRKLRGNQEKKKKNQTGCSLFRGDRGPPDNHLPGVSARKGGFGGDFKRSGG